MARVYPLFPSILFLAAAMLVAPLPVLARDSLGMYATWGAFRDAAVPRCYAIGMAEPSQRRRDYQPYASIGTWPKRTVRNQIHLRLSRQLAPRSRITLTIGRERFQLTGGGGDAWAADRRMDAAIVAAMRSASNLSVFARDVRGNSFSDHYPLEGAASAMDAAAIGCARLR